METFSFLTPIPSPVHIYLLGHSSPSLSCPVPVDERLSPPSDHPDQPRRMSPSGPSHPKLPPWRWWQALEKVQVLNYLSHTAHPARRCYREQGPVPCLSQSHPALPGHSHVPLPQHLQDRWQPIKWEASQTSPLRHGQLPWAVTDSLWSHGWWCC